MKSKKDTYERLIIKVLSLLVAIAIYTTFKFVNLDSRTVSLPLEVIMPDNLVALSLVPEKTDVLISGDDNLIYLVDPDKIKVSADFSTVVEEGVSIVPINLTYDIGLFKDTTIYFRAVPDVIRIKFEALDV